MQAHTPQASSYGASVLALSPDQQPARYRPWEQKDLLNRLKTFRPRSWFGRPLHVNAISCARHGWINSGPDTLKCEFCGECMDLPIRPRWSAQQVQKAAEEYAGRLVSGHATSCPWRDTVCDAKLGKFPKLPARDVYVDFEQRYARLDGISHLPPLSEQAVAALQGSHGEEVALVLQKQLKAKSMTMQQPADPKASQAVSDVFQGLAEQGTDAFVRRACLLAACGWDAFQLSSIVGRASPQQAAAGLPHGACEMQDGVVACGMCGARVGLWSFAHQPEVDNQEVGEPTSSPPPDACPEPRAEPRQSLAAAIDEATPCINEAAPGRRETIKRHLSRSIAGGPIVSPSRNAASLESPDHQQGHLVSSPPVPQTAASTSGPPAPFGSPLPQAPFGSAHQRPAFGSALQHAAEGSSSTRAGHRAGPFGSPLQAPAFGSSSGSAFDSPAFFTPPASMPHQATAAAPQSTIAFGGLPLGTPDSAFATPASAFGTPLSGFGSPAFHTPAGTVAGQGFASRGQAFGTPIPAFGINSASGGQEASEEGPFGAPAFGSGAPLPAFGLAVLKSPPQSRSPSLGTSRPPSASPLVPAATLPATAAESPLSSANPNTTAGAAAAKATYAMADATAVDDQPSGSKRKRESEVVVERTVQPSASKQPRLDIGVVAADKSRQTFDCVKSHKSFCPWVMLHGLDKETTVCGWQWCLSSLAEHWDKDPSAVEAPPSQGQSQRLRQALASIRRN